MFHDEQDDEIMGNESLPSTEENYLNVNVNPDLLSDKKGELLDLIYKYKDIFSSTPGTTQLAEHQINLIDTQPFDRSHIPYHTPRLIP
jgi:hypothetical protein